MLEFFGNSIFLDYEKLNLRHLNNILRRKKHALFNYKSISRATLCIVQRLMASDINISQKNMFYPDIPLLSLDNSEYEQQHIETFVLSHAENIYHNLHKYN